MIKVAFAGDFCTSFLPNKGCELLENTGLNQICAINDEVDYSFINIECPFTVGGEVRHLPINKQGPSLIGDERTVAIIKQTGFTSVNLANNHIYDYGDMALKHTINCIKESGLDYLGAGANAEEASLILCKTFNNYKVTFINCCEHEFSIATEKHGGANPLDIIKQYYQIQEAKHDSDFVVMIIHGGVEHFQYPTPRMVKLYRFFIDAGADAVVNHHQHCPCGYEEYNGKPIFYGLGNFFFPWEGEKNSIWNLGYLVKLSLDKQKVGYEIIPYRQCDNSYYVKLLEGEDLESFNKMMEELCSAIHDEKLLKEKLCEFNRKNDYLYRKMFEPYSGRVMNALYRRGLLPSFIGKDRILALIDFIGCESHYERVMDYLDNKYNHFFFNE